MTAGIYARGTSMALRGVTLAARLLLVLLLARFLDPEMLGLYGLLAASVGYSLFAVGLDFYAFSTREVIKHPRAVWGRFLKSQGALAVLAYAVAAPGLLLLFVASALPWWIAPWFFGLLAMEHVGQEMDRLLVAASEPLMASLLLFVRSGLWSISVVLSMSLLPTTRHLAAVLIAWTLGGMLALGMSLAWLRQAGLGGWNETVDWRWLRRGVLVALPLLLGTLALRSLFTFDRYWVRETLGEEILGAYVLFAAIASALTGFLAAGVHVFLYPKLIADYQNERPAAFSRGTRRMLVQTLGIAAAYGAMSLLAMNAFLEFLGRDLYVTYSNLYPWLLAGVILFNMGMIPHYALYAQGKDGAILWAHLSGLIAFAFFTLTLLKMGQFLAIPIALFLAFLTLLVVKTSLYLKLTESPYIINWRRNEA